MQENQHKQHPNYRKILLIVGVFSLLSLGGLVYSLSQANKTINQLNEAAQLDKSKSAQDLATLQEQLSNSNSTLNKTRFQRDSALTILKRVENYFPFIGMLQYRDSVSAALPYEVGDIVLIKPDSLKGVITDIITGGTSFSQSVQFKVMNRNKEERVLDSSMLWPYKQD
jgi:hypothetical protein